MCFGINIIFELSAQIMLYILIITCYFRRRLDFWNSQRRVSMNPKSRQSAMQ